MKFSITEKPGKKIVGIHHKGRNDILIIICNGKGATKDSGIIKGLAEGLSKKGSSVVRFDFLGTGESSQSKGIFIRQMVEDIDAVAGCFHHYQTIILLGGSLGALLAVISSFTNPKISGLVTVNGFFGTGKLDSKHKRLYFFYRLLMLISPRHRKDFQYWRENYHPEKLTVPTLVIYTKADRVVNPVQSTDFYSQLRSSKKKKLAQLPLLKHNLTGKGDVGKVVEAIDSWMT